MPYKHIHCRIIGFLIAFAIFSGCIVGAVFLILKIESPDNYCIVLAIANDNCYNNDNKIEQFYILDKNRTGMKLCNAHGICQPNACTQQFAINGTYGCVLIGSYYDIDYDPRQLYFAVAFIFFIAYMALLSACMSCCINRDKENGEEQEVEMTEVKEPVELSETRSTPRTNLSETTN